MACKIVGIIKPYDRKQQFSIFKDGNKIQTIDFKMEDLNDGLVVLAQQFETNQIDLVGPKQYIRGLIKQIKELEKTKYSKDELEINII